MDMFQGRMDLAVKYGADVAIFVHNVVYWVEKNAANRVNFHDGRYWTYNSAEALGEMYPLWSRDQIKRLVKRCSDLGLLILGDYNSDRRDRTKWYTPSDEILELYGLGRFALCIGRNRPMHSADSPDASGEIAPPLPSIDQVGTTDPPYSPPMGDKPVRKRKRSNEHKDAPDWKPERFAAFWTAYPRGESKQAAIKAWDALQPNDELLLKMSKGLKRALASKQWIEAMQDGSFKGIPYASTWLNQARWTDETRAVPTPSQQKESKRRAFHKEIIDGEEVFVYDDEPS